MVRFERGGRGDRVFYILGVPRGRSGSFLPLMTSGYFVLARVSKTGTCRRNRLRLDTRAPTGTGEGHAGNVLRGERGGGAAGGTGHGLGRGAEPGGVMNVVG